MRIVEPGATTAGLLVLLGIAAVLDVRFRRIPNLLTAGGLLLGLALGFADGRVDGLLESVAGAGTGLLLFLPLYAVGAMGAGDVKLLASAGSFLGFPAILWGALCTAMAGGLLAVVLLAARGRPAVRGRAAASVPYAVALAAGCSFAVLFPSLSPL